MKYFTSKSQIIIWGLFIAVLGIPCLLMPLHRAPANVPLYTSVVVAIFIFFFIVAAVSWGYPELTEKELEVRNVLYRFYRKHYTYDNIRKVEICRGSIYHWPCIRVYLKSGEKVYWHSIDCMSQDSIPEFLRELHEHGIDAVCLVEYK